MRRGRSERERPSACVKSRFFATVKEQPNLYKIQHNSTTANDTHEEKTRMHSVARQLAIRVGHVLLVVFVEFLLVVLLVVVQNAQRLFTFQNLREKGDGDEIYDDDDASSVLGLFFIEERERQHGRIETAKRTDRSSG
jgi:hypothetical protein